MMAASDEVRETTKEPLRVLVADHDRDISELVTAILTDEGYAVTALDDTDHATIAAAVGRLEPDCILLDSAEGPAFGGSWTEAQYLSSRSRGIPTIMFSAHAEAVREAQEQSTERAAAARLAGIVSKPFSVDELLDAVGSATGRSERFDRSEAGDTVRTTDLVEELRSAGATDVRTGNRREWATFTSPTGDRIYQLYWWQRQGRYIVGRYDDDARLEMVGQFFERRAAIEAVLRPVRDTEV